MASDVFDRETLLDLSVNVIPLFIILFFVALFVVIAPFGYSLVPTTIQMALLIAPFAALAVLTYYSGKAVASAEAEMEAREREIAEADTAAGTSDLEGDDSGEEGELTGEEDGSGESPEPAITEAEADDGTDAADEGDDGDESTA
jgi:hypothetical protein